MYIEINNMHSRNKFNLSPDKRTYSVTLENRQNILENSSLIFPLISNSNTYNKKFNTIEADNYGIKFHSSCKPNCFKDIQRRKIDNKLFLDRYDDLKNGRLKNNKYLETLEAKENFKKNKSFCLPYTNKNLSLLETKHKPVDSFSILKESLNLKLTNSSFLSNYISKNILLKGKLIQNFKKNMSFEKMHKRRSDELDYETHKQTSDYDTISYNNRKENSWNNAENKYASYHQFQKMLPLSEFSLNNPKKFENECIIIHKADTNDISFEAKIDKEEKSSNDDKALLSKDNTKAETFDLTNNSLNIFMELEKKLEDHLNPKKNSNSGLQESLYRISNYKTKYELYKIFCQDVISSYPESGKLINKIILDFDEIINSLIQEFNKSREKIEKIEKTYKKYNNLYIKYTKSQTTLKNKEEEISQLKNKIKEFELKTKTDALKRKSNSVNKNNTIDKVDSNYFSTELDEIKFVDKVYMKSDIKENKDNLAIPKLDLSFNITKNNKKKNKSYVDNGTSFIINDISKISQNLKANKPKENKESVNKPKINYTLLNRSKLIQNMKMKKKLNETKNNSNKMDL